MQKQFQSTVGYVIDVATPATRKLRALGFLWILIALFPFALLNYLIIQSLTSSEPLITSKPTYAVGALLMIVIGWYALGSAVQRFRAASTEGRYFRSGPGGISVFLTDDYAASTFRFSLNNLKFDLPWDQIKTWYPYTETMNGIPTERALVFETLKSEKIKVKTYHFAEAQKQIVASLTRSRSIVPDEPLAAASAQSRGQQEFSIPRSAGEATIEYKKKRDHVKQIDLTNLTNGKRAGYVEKIVDLLETNVMSRAAGFKSSRKRYKPFKEWPHTFGFRLFLRRGLLFGYEIQVEPNDSESRRITISICRWSLISNIRRYLSIAAGVVIVGISFKWLNSIGHWLGDFDEATPLVMVVIFVIGLAIATGLLELPIRLSRLIFSDKKREQAERQEILVGIEATGEDI